jgi:tetratricopeptide (TPR) repeat protein
MESTTTPLYRVFLSSTAIDLKDHREKVKNAILKMGDLPVAMEFFGAQPSEPVEACKAKVRDCDALCVFLAHRYGWVPTIGEGGDGHKSITWIEMETALELRKPVFAFVVDETYKWGEPKEQDLLIQAENKTEEEDVIRKVKALKEFRKFLESHKVRDTFFSPDDLATKVLASLSGFIRKELSGNNEQRQLKTRTLVFREVHPLQPATHFCGRKDLLKDFTAWWNDPISPDRVRSLIAMGGTGKTALIQHFLENCIDKKSLKGSVLVWSFYEDPNTDAFLEEALNIFAGESGDEYGIGGRLSRLQRALSAGEPHLLILDGLELIQSEGATGRAWGELEDHRIKNLLRSIAGGSLGKTRAIITSRFKVTDLGQWEHRGYKGIELNTLDTEGAVNLLQAWQVKGEVAQLQSLAESLGRHALSVSVLGSYLKNYCNGELAGAAEFKLDEAGMDDSQAAKLSRILAKYATNLSDNERDLLIRLSIFPRGISVEILGYLIAAGGEIAGALVGFEQSKLLRLAEHLCKLGLVYTYKLRNNITYTAHPFLREYFRKLLGVPPEKIHEAVRGKLAVGLETKPDSKPSDSKTLDRYESLIEQTILAGQIKDAYELYFNVMGGGSGQNHLFHIVGDYGRIIRILSMFSKNGQPETLELWLSLGQHAYLISVWGVVAQALGDLDLAGRCFEKQIENRRKLMDWNNYSKGLHNRAAVARDQGAFPAAKKLLNEAFKHVEQMDRFSRRINHSGLAATCHDLGEIQEAGDHFKKATEFAGEQLYGNDGIYEADHLFRLSLTDKAYEHTINNLTTCEKIKAPRDIARCHTMLGLFSLPSSITKAREYLNKTRKWTDQSGDMECIIRAHRLAAEIALYSGDLDAAITEATTGLNQAETCGYGKFAIDLLIQLSRIHLAIPDPGKALTYSRKALDWSSKPEVSYAWGIADAAELCGKCHKELGEHELAARYFKQAEVARAPLHL